MMKLQSGLPLILAALVGCMATEEDFRVPHEGVLKPVQQTDDEKSEPETEVHVGAWTIEDLAVRAGRLSREMREGEMDALMARMKADADTAWKDPEFRYTGRWGNGESHSYERWGDSSSQMNQFGARLYIPNPFVNRYLSRKGEADVRRCEAKAEAGAYAVYVEVKLLCAEYLRSGRELELLERKAKIYGALRDLSNVAATNFVADSPYELIRSETAYARNHVKLELLRASRAKLRQNLAVLAQVPGEGLEIADGGAVSPEAPSVERLCELAFIRRPDLAEAIAEYDAAVAGKSAAKAAYVPWFRFVEAAYRAERGSDTDIRYSNFERSGDDSNGSDFGVEVAITIPLFTWCGDSVGQSDRLRRLADERVRSLRDAIRGEIAAEVANYRSALLLQGAVSAEFNETMTKRLDELAQDHGMESVEEYKARLELLDHELLRSNLVYALAEARARLEAAAGGPLVP